MFIIPAIDLKDGKCVRLFKGELRETTVYSDDPVQMAKKWEDLGAERIHLVDLDGAFSGAGKNYPIIACIAKEVKIPVQLGGGIRDMGTIEAAFAMGVQRVILGTAAVKNPQLVKKACRDYGEGIIIGADVRDGMVSISGWTEATNEEIIDFLKKMEDFGAQRFIVTDVGRDGTLEGPNFALMERIVALIRGKVIASGGVGSMEDVRRLQQLAGGALEGVIVGKALYEGKITLQEQKS